MQIGDIVLVTSQRGTWPAIVTSSNGDEKQTINATAFETFGTFQHIGVTAASSDGATPSWLERVIIPDAPDAGPEGAVNSVAAVSAKKRSK